jgi:preprotein translocase subunit SecA
MAGRGTDIKLTQESRIAGGLAIVGTERHESRRVDRQLRGRSGRQGDPGSSQFFVSLEDNLMRLFGSDRIAKLMDRMGLQEGEVIQHSMITKSIERAQKKVEENNFGIRKRLLEYDDVMNSQREVIYKRRRNALFGERLQLDILNMLYDTCEDIAINARAAEDYDSLMLNCISILGLDFKFTKDEFENVTENELADKLYNASLENYKEKNRRISERAKPIFKDIHKNKGGTVTDVLVPFTDGKKQIGVSTNLDKNIETDCRELILSLEKISTLAIIDQLWKEHLREMDDLKQSVQNAVYEQKDPLLIYKFEAFELFKRFVARVNEDTISFLTKADLPVQQPDQVQEARNRREARRNYRESKEESKSLLSGGDQQAAAKNRPPVEKAMPRKVSNLPGRNERISVQYEDGTIKKNVKFKTVEQDVVENKCVIIED